MASIISGISGADRKSIEDILRSTGFFYEFEIQTALEIADETIRRGSEESGYHWIKMIENDKLVAFANFGKNSFSVHSWDLYWIAVHDMARHKNLGSLLLNAVEEEVKKSEGRMLWVETSEGPCMLQPKPFTGRMDIPSGKP